MIILGVETSCDETALSLIEIEAEGTATVPATVKILANNVLSQIAIHKEYGGVFPMMAKREHAKNLVPLFKKTLEEANFSDSRFKIQDSGKNPKSDLLNPLPFTLTPLLDREPELLKQFLEFIPTIEKPPIDLIAVTIGPGLEPCLWTGLNFAKALSVAWDIPVVAANHMEGHVLVSLQKRNEELSIINYQLSKPNFPALALLISGGHTEMVLMKKLGSYEIVGKTRDDAIGEAFDKVARILGLPYPGGPEISALAELARKSNHESRIMNQEIKLPRPMIHSGDLDFSFSGLKTSVLYLVKKLPQPLDERTKMEIACEFEDSATEVIVEKVKKAIEMYGAETLILGGGVVANKNIRGAFEKLSAEKNDALK